MTLVRTGRDTVVDVGEARTMPLETRDPSGSTLKVQYVGYDRPMPPEWDSWQAIRMAYLANVYVYRCVETIARALSMLPFRAGADPDKPADWNPNARLAQLLGPPPKGPNPHTSARQLWMNTVAQYLVTGRFAWEYEEAKVAHLWPLAVSWLEVTPSEGGARYFKRFRYGRPENRVTIPLDRILYHWRPSLGDWRQPESVLQSARLAVSIAVMQDRYDFAFLRNDSRPAGIVVHEAFAESSQAKAFRQQFQSEHQGPSNAGKAAFVESSGGEKGVVGSVAWIPTGISQKDTQALERYEQKVSEITIAFGVPKSLLGDSSKRTFSNADRENVNFWQNTMLPLIDEIQDAINMQLAPRVGTEVGWFDLSKVAALQPPPKFNASEAVTLTNGGIATKNEARAEVGLPPVDGGDDFREQPATDPTPAPLPAPIEEPRVAPIETRAWTADELEQRRARIWTTAISQVANLERIWERAWQRIFRRQERTTLGRLDSKRGRQAIRTEAPDLTLIFDPDFWQTETIEEARLLYEQVVAAGGARISDLFGIAFDVDAPYAQEFIGARSNQLAGFVTDTTYRKITEQMAEGAGLGESIPDLAERIRKVFADATSLRAQTIARTEVISAYNGSAVAAASQLPGDVAAGQEWIATRDARTRDAHVSADGQVVIVGSPFSVGGMEMAYPGDPSGGPSNTVNCRCTLAFLTPDEYAELAVPRSVPVKVARSMLSLVRPGRFDPGEFRRALQEAAA